jgi:hypothetical protein
VAERFADGQADKEELLRVSKMSDGQGTWAFTLSDAFEAARFCACEDRLKAAVKVGLIRCIFGNPFCPVATEPSWLAYEVQSLAEAAYKESLADATLDPLRLGVLADALEEELTRLSLSGCAVGDAGAQAFAESPHLRKLVGLNLSNNAVTATGARDLAGSTQLPALADLALYDRPSRIDPETAAALRTRFAKVSMNVR